MRITGTLTLLCASAVLSAGCSYTHTEVTKASCTACADGAYTATECEALSRAAGCASWSIGEAEGDCLNRCSFRDCSKVPACERPRDAGPDAPASGSDT